MKKYLNRYMLLSLCLCVVLGVELFVLADGIVVCNGGMLPLYTPVFTVPVAALVLFTCFREKWKSVLVLVILIPAAFCLFAGLGYLGWKSFSSSAVYENPDSGKHQLYGDRNVMVIVPHQDDELNILGGVMEEYVRYGSEIRVVFVTNGDHSFSAETRMREALAVCANIGIPKDCVVFLGYGNEWKKGGPHIYNGKLDEVLSSYNGNSVTYGMEEHPAYREGRTYTREHLEEDLESVILEYTPEIIFCSDYDHHIDHKAVSLLFEKVMGNILKDNPDYTPVVYKGYAYGTAWESAPDYYADNILSTRNPFEEPYNQRPVIYRWEERIRLPVAGDTLSRSLIGAPAYQTLALHDSQGAVCVADRVISGDRVFWQRDTGSLILRSEVAVSSGEADLLRDFMLVENDNLVNPDHLPYDGVWVPEKTDTSKSVSVTLAESSDLATIVLYDHPSPEDNVINAVISFDDGTSLETGPLDPDGAATYIFVNKKWISGFSVSLAETEGDMAGLSEIEAFCEMPEKDGSFIKLMDMDGDFAYDYQTESDGHCAFSLYIHGELPEVTAEKYSVETVSNVGTAELDGDTIRVFCPAGQTMVLNVTCDVAGVSDSIVVRNPGGAARWWSDFWTDVEEEMYARFIRSDSTFASRLNLCRVWERVSYLIRHI